LSGVVFHAALLAPPPVLSSHFWIAPRSFFTGVGFCGVVRTLHSKPVLDHGIFPFIVAMFCGPGAVSLFPMVQSGRNPTVPFRGSEFTPPFSGIFLCWMSPSRPVLFPWSTGPSGSLCFPPGPQIPPPFSLFVRFFFFFFGLTLPVSTFSQLLWSWIVVSVHFFLPPFFDLSSFGVRDFFVKPVFPLGVRLFPFL